MFLLRFSYIFTTYDVQASSTCSALITYIINRACVFLHLNISNLIYLRQQSQSKLTHLCPLDSSVSFNRMSLFVNKGVPSLVYIYYLYHFKGQGAVPRETHIWFIVRLFISNYYLLASSVCATS